MKKPAHLNSPMSRAVGLFVFFSGLVLYYSLYFGAFLMVMSISWLTSLSCICVALSGSLSLSLSLSLSVSPCVSDVVSSRQWAVVVVVVVVMTSDPLTSLWRHCVVVANHRNCPSVAADRLATDRRDLAALELGSSRKNIRTKTPMFLFESVPSYQTVKSRTRLTHQHKFIAALVAQYSHIIHD